jgi:peptide/nickel transport system permease protein
MDASSRLQGPGGHYLLGTDEFGRDILSRLIHGARLSLFVSLSSVMIASTLGSALGLTVAYSGGKAELLGMRLIDAVLSFPPILLALFVVVFIGPELRNVILTISVLYMPRFGRVVHGVTLSIKQEEYVEAARAVGSPSWRILSRTILPNVMAPIIVQFSLFMGSAILLESSLSFLGLGPPPPAVAWGRMIAESSPYMHLNSYVIIWPAVVISATVITFNILGDALRDALDPHLRGR